MALNNYEEAVVSINKAIKNNTRNINFANSLKGEALFYLGKYEESKKVFLNLLKENPNSFFSIAYLTDIDINLGNYLEGIERAEKALEEKRLDIKDSAYIEVNIGWIKLKYLNDLEGAYNHFSTATNSDKELGTAYVGFGEYYLIKEEYQKAIENYEMAIELYENTIDVYLVIAKDYKGLWQLEDALEYFKVVYNADLENEYALNEIKNIEKTIQ